ncbi:hypothetical protein CspHIS471_0310460 [Cutaneotrichosporon sp. HIS471]|nr:hypothetical protein CspHIS471_0310460 [Cutaneotrichosporon sp. HIS471]
MGPIDDIPEGVDPTLWTYNHINEEHLAAFEHALSLQDTAPTEGDASPAILKSPTLSPHDAPEWSKGVEKLTATSDFAPIHSRVRKRRSAGQQSLGLTYHLIRWPLLMFFFLIIWLEFSAYVLTRQVVNVFEWLFAWRGVKRVLKRQLRKAKSYEEWRKTAKELDDNLGFDDWKETDNDGYFDASLVRRVRATLYKLRVAKDTRALMDALSICVRPNFAGTESARMYSETFYGTKTLVEAHVKEVAAGLDFVRTSSSVTLEEKRAFFRRLNKNYGTSALCLSGGASFGYYHFGVARALLDHGLLPRIITGTSAGGLIAALVCTYTDSELKQLIRPELADKITALEDPFSVWIRRWMQTGARFSALEWARKAMYFTRGSLTFKEAYERTGRALNVSVVPADRHSPTILLNHLTAPNCVIWSAIIASAAVPGILNPVVLMAKDRDGSVRPHNLGGSRFKDGSLREDIPLSSLHTQFNCNFSIVSQTNPHIHLFFFAPRGAVGRPVAHRKGRGWRGGFILSALESYIKLDLSKHFKVIRDLDLLPQLLQSDWSGVFLQRFFGDLNLIPKSRLLDWLHILDDPDRKGLERMILVGQRATWPTVHMVHNRAKIENAIYRGRAEVRMALARERPSAAPTGTMPIESDADAAIALRARRADGQGGGSGRRRRPDRLQIPRNLNITDVQAVTSSNELPRSNTAPSFGDTFRQMRSSPLAAFGLKNRSRSRRSLSAWLGGGSDSSPSDDEVDLGAPEWRADAAAARNGLNGDNDVFLDSGEVSAAMPDSAADPSQDGSASDP